MLTKGMWSEIEKNYDSRVRLAVFDFTDEATTEATRAEAQRLGLGAVLEEAGFAPKRSSLGSTAAATSPSIVTPLTPHSRPPSASGRASVLWPAPSG